MVLSTLFLLSACSPSDKAPATRASDDLGVATGAVQPAETEAGEASEPVQVTLREGSVKVLPDSWGPDEIKAYMKEVANGLGVTCDHCHVLDDLASDELATKIAARKMMKMTMELDANHLGGQGTLTCATCHKGQERPPN